MEGRQKINKFFSITKENIRDCFWFSWIGDEDLNESKNRSSACSFLIRKSERKRQNLENVKCFELDVFAFLFQQIHLLFEIVCIGDIFGHHRKVIPIEQQFAKQLKEENNGNKIIAQKINETQTRWKNQETLCTTLNRSKTSRLYISKAEVVIRLDTRPVLVFKTKASDGNIP